MQEHERHQRADHCASQGTNAEEAKAIIDESGLEVRSAILLKEAATRSPTCWRKRLHRGNRRAM